MVLKVAGRGRIPPFIVMDMLREANELAAQGQDIVHLEIGQPGTGAPRAVIEAAKAALDADRLAYTDAFGVPALRQQIAGHYRQKYGRDVPIERIVVTTGSSAAFVLAFIAAFDPGDRVALAEPGYPAYKNILQALDIEPVGLPVGPDERFQPTPALLERAGKLDGLILASPSNPTGTMLETPVFQALVEHCRRHGIRLISDEIYHGITYDRPADTALAFTEDAVVINSFSKYYAMTGWRLGWMVVPEDLVRAVECLCQNLYISPPTLSQRAAIAAFDCAAELDGNVARYARNRALLLDGLPKIGLDRLAPADGAFYIYADVRHVTNDSHDFCRRMLEEAGVAAAPGVDFDTARGAAFVRFSFAGTTEEVARGLTRLGAWLK
ncbi:MAG: pyridoxal phosphate-dependent aminotransferase [Candidatus Eiseniibacteriota bacterium]